MGASSGPGQGDPAAIGKAIGIVGGGQLAWMLAESARRHNVPLHVQTPGAQDPAVAIATSVVSKWEGELGH